MREATFAEQVHETLEIFDLVEISWSVLHCQTPVLGLGIGVDFTFAGDNHKNHKNENDNPHLSFVKGTVLGDKEQGVGIRDKG